MEEKQDYEQGNRSFLRKQGFYIVLFLCLLIVGTAIVLTALPDESAEQPQGEDPSVVVETNQSRDETLNTRATNSPLPTATPAPTPTATPTATPRQANASYTKKGAAPVSGDIIMTYAADQLLYSRTLDQWTTHMGIDIASEAGTEVKAAMAGTVERVYEDDALGWTVQIAHTNDRASVYANLEEGVPVSEGQKVNAGDVIGKVGASAISECADLPHLHFAFLVEGTPVDPTSYVNIPH